MECGVAVGLVFAAACGGNATSRGDGPEHEQPNAGTGAGGSAGSGAVAGTANGTHAGQGGTSQQGAGGACTKLCVPTASFVISSPVAPETLQSGRLKACRRGEAECFEGEVPPPTHGNTVSFQGAKLWSGPVAFSTDGWHTLQFSWSGVDAMPPLADGDRFTLALETDDESVTLLDKVVDFETVVDCAGSCLNAFMDLRGEPHGEGGAGGAADASSDAGGAGHGGAR